MSLSGQKQEAKGIPGHDKKKKPPSKSSKGKPAINRAEAQNRFLSDAKQGDAEKVIGWLNNFFDYVSSEIAAAFKVATEQAHFHLLKLLYDAQRKYFEDQDPNTLEILPVIPSDKTFFVVQHDKEGRAFKVLTKKGVAFVLDHYYKGKKILCVSAINIYNPIDLFVNSREKELIIFIDLGKFYLHRLIIKCEREGNEIRIIKLDSTPTNEQAIDEFDTIVELIEEDKGDKSVSYYSNTTYQQNLTKICGNFSVVNIGLAGDRFFQQINPFCVRDNDVGVPSYLYPLPPDFMHLTGSYQLLIEYIGEMLNRLQVLKPDDVNYKSWIHMLDQLVAQAFQPREIKEAKMMSPEVVTNRDKFKRQKSKFFIKNIADVMPKDQDAMDHSSDKTSLVCYDTLDDFLSKNRGKDLKRCFVEYMNAFQCVYKNHTAEIYVEQHAHVFNGKSFSLQQINQTAMHYDAMLYEVSPSGDIVFSSAECDKRQTRQNQQFSLMRDMALQSWVLADESRRNKFIQEIRIKFPLLANINLLLFLTEEMVIAIFKEEGLATAYFPYPIDFFRANIGYKADSSLTAMDTHPDEEQGESNASAVGESQSSRSGIFSKVCGKRNPDTLDDKEAKPAEPKKAKPSPKTSTIAVG